MTSASTPFFAAYPSPRLVRLSPESGVSFSEVPACERCSAGLVTCLDRVLFNDMPDLPDLFLPSSLPGWLAASERVLKLVENGRLTNIQFLEGFVREEWRIVRKGYWALAKSGFLERSEEVAFES